MGSDLEVNNVFRGVKLGRKKDRVFTESDYKAGAFANAASSVVAGINTLQLEDGSIIFQSGIESCLLYPRQDTQ